MREADDHKTGGLLAAGETTGDDVLNVPMSCPSPQLPRAEESPEPAEDDKEERISQASVLVGFVKERAELFHDESSEVYARDRDSGEVRRLDGRPFRDWLQASFYEATEKSARDQSLREAIGTLSGLARFAGECLPVCVRVALHDGSYWLDLARAGESMAVRVEPGAWQIVNDPPVMFLRTETMRPLPLPVRGAGMRGLWGLVNIPEDAHLLVLAWLAECLRPDTPFPVLELIGEQGSAKSTTQSILRRLIDPNACDLRSAPKSAEDVFVGAGVNWLVSYENISHLPAPMQDALCVLATGGGFAKRKLYSDADEAVIQVKRPIVLNGISAAITAQDLIDRSISVETPIISERRETTGMWREFDQMHPRLLGALLAIFAEALRRLPTVSLPSADRPRLIEFAHLGIAIAQATGKSGDDFMREFNRSRQESIARTIDASPVATALIDWFTDRGEQAAEMAVKALFHELDRFKPAQTDAWPKSAKGFADAMRRAAPALRQLGIECRSLGKLGGTVRWAISQRKTPTSRPESPACPEEDAEPAPEQDIRTCRTSQRELSPADAEVEI